MEFDGIIFFVQCKKKKKSGLELLNCTVTAPIIYTESNRNPFIREVALNDDVTRGSGATEGDSNRPCRKLKRCCPDVDRQDFTTSGQQGALKTFCIGCDFTSGMAVNETVSYQKGF